MKESSTQKKEAMIDRARIPSHQQGQSPETNRAWWYLYNTAACLIEMEMNFQCSSLIIKIMKLVVLDRKGYQELGRGRAVLMVLPLGSAEEAAHQPVETPVHQRAFA